jgi:hypothetical protein
MRAKLLLLAGSVLLALVTGAAVVVLLLGPAEAAGQQLLGPAKGTPGPPDEEKEILKQIKEAYKAPFEVHKDVLSELRKQYQQPTPEREAKIFKELRRLYLLSEEQEAAILQELRRAYQRPSAEQEQRVFQEIARAQRLPEGTVPPSVQVEQARKMFSKLDANGDGLLSPDEMPAALRNELGRWDTNHDRFISLDEYWAYYQGRLGALSEQVASGQLGGMPGGAGPAPLPPGKEESRATVYRAGNLPAGLPPWFYQLDTDGDGQVGLYEWKKSGRPFEEFDRIDRNGDGFITVAEVKHYQAQQPAGGAGGVSPLSSGTVTVSTGGKAPGGKSSGGKAMLGKP